MKVQHAPDLSTISDTFTIMQTEAKPAINNRAQTLDDLKNELKSITETSRQSAAAMQQSINIGEEARAAAKEAAGVGKAVMEMTREIETKGLAESGKCTGDLRRHGNQRPDISTHILCTKSQRAVRADAT